MPPGMLSNNGAGLSQWKADPKHLLRDVQDVLPCRGRRQVLRERLQDIWCWQKWNYWLQGGKIFLSLMFGSLSHMIKNQISEHNNSIINCMFHMIGNNKLNTLQEFLMAIDVTSAGTPREKLLWAFRFLFSNHQCLIIPMHAIFYLGHLGTLIFQKKQNIFCILWNTFLQ